MAANACNRTMRAILICFQFILLLSGMAMGEGLREHREKNLLIVAEGVRQGILKKDAKAVVSQRCLFC